MARTPRRRLGLAGSVRAALKGSAKEGFGGDVWGLPVGVAIGVWWWARGAPVAAEGDDAET